MPRGFFKRTKEHGKHISEALIGRKLTQEHCDNIGKAGKGRIPPNKGTHLSKKKREKISIATTIAMNTPEMKKYMKKNNYDKRPEHNTKKHNESISLGLLKAWKNEETLKKLKKRRQVGMTGKRHTKEVKRKMRIAHIKYVKSCIGELYPNYSKKACRFFDEVNKKFELNGLHAENKGEHFILGYWLDYYEPNLNLVIEWNEERHYKGDNKTQKHISRQNEIRDYLGCYFINIRQKDFVYNKEAIMKRIENIIKIKKYKHLKEV